MGARPGDTVQFPGFDQADEITHNFIEIFTGNPNDERRGMKREEMDPAILRELTGVEVPYMETEEMFDVIRARLIEENGVLKLSESEVDYVKRLCGAANMMQRIHNHDFEGFSDVEKANLGIDQNPDISLNTNFLDPGTLFKVFGEWELEKARGIKFVDYLKKKLGEFIKDPKSLSIPEERELLQKVLEMFVFDVLQGGQEGDELREKGYILPSEMAGSMKQGEVNPLVEVMLSEEEYILNTLYELLQEGSLSVKCSVLSSIKGRVSPPFMAMRKSLIDQSLSKFSILEAAAKGLTGDTPAVIEMQRSLIEEAKLMEEESNKASIFSGVAVSLTGDTPAVIEMRRFLIEEAKLMAGESNKAYVLSRVAESLTGYTPAAIEMRRFLIEEAKLMVEESNKESIFSGVVKGLCG